MSSCEKLIERLYRLAPPLVKPGLKRERLLLQSLNNPQYSYPTVHVAGTNGKGSTCAFLHSILRESSLKAALYTSPHILKFNERIKMGDGFITNADISSLVSSIGKKAASLGIRPTFFEFTTAMAFEYFRKKKAGIAVVETGMGGRLDATNVLRPEVCVITSIGLEHTRELGRTTEAIAKEKSGIIKRGTCVVTAVEDKDALRVIRAEARRKKARLYEYGRDFSMRSGKDGLTYKGINEYKKLKLSLLGDYQLKNAACAVMAAELLSIRFPSVGIASIRKGLIRAKWPGRFEVLSKRPRIVADCAHNPEGARALAKALRREKGRIVLIIGIMADKDVLGIMRELSSISGSVIFVTPPNERSADKDTLLGLSKKAGLGKMYASSMEEALCKAAAIAKTSGTVCITGSIFTVAWAMSALRERSKL